MYFYVLIKNYTRMKRREFLTKGIGAGLLTGGAASIGGFGNLFAAGFQENGDRPFDMIAVRGGEPDEMFDLAIEAAGGMGKYVKPGQTVVVKPNAAWDTPPERAANTNPELVRRIVEQCYTAGAKQVDVFDHTCDKWDLCYKNSGIEQAVRDAGGRMVPGNTESFYHEVPIVKGKSLKNAKVHELILNSDVYINVPVLKHHGSTRLTIAMKNLMGVVWDRRWWHRNDLHQCIADYTTFYRQPDLNIVDAYRVMLRNGPRGVSVDDVVIMKSLILSEDIVAVDAASALLFGMEPDEVNYIGIADEMGVGTADLDKLNIKRIRV